MMERTELIFVVIAFLLALIVGYVTGAVSSGNVGVDDVVGVQPAVIEGEAAYSWYVVQYPHGADSLTYFAEENIVAVAENVGTADFTDICS